MNLSTTPPLSTMRLLYITLPLLLLVTTVCVYKIFRIEGESGQSSHSRTFYRLQEDIKEDAGECGAECVWYPGRE